MGKKLKRRVRRLNVRLALAHLYNELELLEKTLYLQKGEYSLGQRNQRRRARAISMYTDILDRRRSQTIELENEL